MKPYIYPTRHAFNHTSTYRATLLHNPAGEQLTVREVYLYDPHHTIDCIISR